MSTLAAVEQIMRLNKTPMSVRDIVLKAGDALPTRSKTPDTVVARDLSMDIKKFGDESRFVRTAPGRYAIREFVQAGLVQMGQGSASDVQLASAPTEVSAPTSVLGSSLNGERQGMRSATPTHATPTQSAVETDSSNLGSL